MSTETPEWDAVCAVCGKSVDHGGGLSHMKFEDAMIALCCPLCIETFNKDPKPYLRRRGVRKLADDALPPGSSAHFDL